MYFVKPADSPVSAQLLRVSSTGYACGRSFFQPGGTWGSFIDVDDEDFTLPWFFPNPEMAMEASIAYLESFGREGFDVPWVGLSKSTDGRTLSVVRQGGWVVAEIPVSTPIDHDYEEWAAKLLEGMRPLASPLARTQGSLLEFRSPKQLIDQLVHYLDWKFPVEPKDGFSWTSPRLTFEASFLERWRRKTGGEFWNDGASGTVGLVMPDGKKVRKHDL